MIYKIVFNKKYLSLENCIMWLIDNGYEFDDLKETNNHYIFKQMNKINNCNKIKELIDEENDIYKIVLIKLNINYDLI